MKGDAQLIDHLNELLAHELGSSELYLAQSQFLRDWGYEKLYARIRHESDDERGHAERLIERIIFLEGTPKMFTRPPMELGSSPKEMLELDLQYEKDIAKTLNDIIAEASTKLDAVTRQILDDLLKDTEEDHIHWLESQLKLIEHVGLEKFLAEQIHA